MTVWYGFASNLFPASEQPVGVATFWSAPSLWFDCYFALCVAIFAAAWMLFAPHPWARWSILGSALILFTSYFQVQVSVAINSWYGPFYDLIQAALSKSRPVTVEEFYSRIVDLRRHRLGRGRRRRADAILRQPLHLPLANRDERFLRRELAAAAHHRGRLAARAGRHHAVCHHDGKPRRQSDQRGTDAAGLPAGAGEAVQPTSPSCRWSARSPIRWSFAAVVWSVFGTGALALIGIRLPGIEFFNQRVEAAYRKELVLGEDDPARADPPTLQRAVRQCSPELFPALSELHVFQRRPHRLFADRRHLSLHPARARRSSPARSRSAR